MNRNNKIKKVFFPGCSLSSYSPELVKKVLIYLQEKLPGTGGILNCCGKPTLDIGQVDKFKERHEKLQKEFEQMEVEEIIVACQSCYTNMNKYSTNLKVTSLWQLLPAIGLPKESIGIGKDSNIVFAIHDSCSTRNVSSIQDGVRWIMKELGYEIEETLHSRENTRCCGFGGMVVPANPQLALKVMKRRTEEVKSDYMVTYCAACREAMAKGDKKAVHILDLVFNNTWTSDSQFPGIPSTPITSWKNRYKTKRNINSIFK
ncbi:Fe-S oxidoreductase [Gottschalkia purinilytica]|uniref:Fe-S oxidoreductase n=1 Tax=Gottschalkia purinilytica TaxID=1503 RepID=A0A0L0W6S7_GOTPU|nr:(Fe-S)-binding protein [Gottschalkia purinilytica]KNF07253.1 Fe-S oxidoreductase [Gottschalkia purinilytica]